MRLVTYIDRSGGPLPPDSNAVEIQETDMETTRASAQKAVDHLLQSVNDPVPLFETGPRSTPTETSSETAPTKATTTKKKTTNKKTAKGTAKKLKAAVTKALKRKPAKKKVAA